MKRSVALLAMVTSAETLLPAVALAQQTFYDVDGGAQEITKQLVEGALTKMAQYLREDCETPDYGRLRAVLERSKDRLPQIRKIADAQERAERLGDLGREALRGLTVGVVEFTDTQNSGRPFSALREILTNCLIRRQVFRDPVERSQIDKVIAEQGLSVSALFDERTASELGKLVAADLMVVGKYTLDPDAHTVTVTPRLVWVSEGVAVSAAFVHIKCTSAIENHLRALGWITVSVTPPDAAVTIDGQTLSPGQKAELNPGQYEVRATKEGYRTRTSHVTVQSGKTSSLDMALEACVGTIEVRCNVAGAEVQVDGKPIGMTSADGRAEQGDIAVGNHTVAVSRDGYRTWQGDVDVADGKRSVVHVTLERLPGAVEVRCSVVRTEVWIDGAREGIVGPDGTLRIDGVPEGTHMVTAARFGYGDWRGKVRVRAGKTTSLDLRLPPWWPIALAASGGAIVLAILALLLWLRWRSPNCKSTLASIRNPAPVFIGRVWSDRELRAERARTRDIKLLPVDSKAAYRTGESIVLCFRCERDCYLTAIDLGTSGASRIIFPNVWFPNNSLRAGETHWIPQPGYGFKYEVGGPRGVESVKAIFTIDPIDITSCHFSQEHPFTEMGSAGTAAAAKALDAELKQISERIVALPTDRWCESTCEFFVDA